MTKKIRTKQEYIDEIRYIIFSELGDHVLTDVDTQASKILDEADDFDYDDYYEARSKGNIVRIDNLFLVWLNGVCFAWNFINGNADLTKEDFIPNFKKVYDDSRCIGGNDDMTFFGEFCRLD